MRRSAETNLTARGAYLLSESRGPRALTLLATGTEVGLAVAAQARLAEVGIDAAVVSMPCWELFEAQDEAYRAEVLGTAPRIGVEAAMPFGWERWLRPGDSFIGMTGFGTSARAEVLYEHFGITDDRIVATGQALAGRNSGTAGGRPPETPE